MAERPVWIIKSKRSQSGRRHMAIFIPNLDCLNEDPNDKSKTCLGTKIHVTGAPMVGFCHEFQRNYSPTYDNTFDFAVKLASIDSTYVKDPPYATFSADQTALGKGLVDDLAFRVPAPAITKDYLNPANAVRQLMNLAVADTNNPTTAKHTRLSELDPRLHQVSGQERIRKLNCCPNR